MTSRHAVIENELGTVTLVADEEGMTGLYFPHHWYAPEADTFGEKVTPSADPVLGTATAQLAEYLAGERREFDLPLHTAGDEFQERVWALLREIPFGETTTYGQLAEQLGDKALAQRVGQAVGRNPLCVFIPCHRVLGAGGKLTGYAGGLDRKQRLLEIEEPIEVSAGKLF